MSYKPTAHGRPGVGSTKGSAHSKWNFLLEFYFSKKTQILKKNKQYY